MLDSIVGEATNKGLFLFDLKFEKLQEKKQSWLGTIVKFTMGLAFVALSIFIPGGGLFMGLVLQGLLAKGIGDMISAVADVITGHPADLKEYLKSTVISIGVIIITAGLLSFVDGIFGGIAILRDIAGPKSWYEIAEVAVKQIAVTVATAGFYEGTRRIINNAHVKQAVSDAIDKLVAQYTSQLNKIFVTKQMSLLYTALGKIVEDNLEKFNSVEDKITKGVLTSIPSYFISGEPAQNGMGGLFSSGADFAENVIKNLQALPEIISDLEKKIIEIAAGAPSKWEMLKTHISTIFTRGNEAGQLINALITQGYTAGNVICDILDEVDLSQAGLSRELQSYKVSLVGACYDIEHLLAVSHDHADFKKTFITQVSSAIISYQKGIAHAVAQAAGTIAGSWSTKPISKFFQSKKAQQAAEQEQEKQERQRMADQIAKKFQPAYKLYTSVNDAPTTGKTDKTDTAPDPGPESTTKSGTYKIKPGDTLSEIASKLNIPLAQLKQANLQITNSDRINVGQKIHIPTGATFSATGSQKSTTGFKAKYIDKIPSLTDKALDELGNIHKPSHDLAKIWDKQATTASTGQSKNSLNNFLKHHPKISKFMEQATNDQITQAEMYTAQAELSKEVAFGVMDVGKNMLNTISKLGEFSWDLLQTTLYLHNNPIEAATLSTKLYQEARTIVTDPQARQRVMDYISNIPTTASDYITSAPGKITAKLEAIGRGLNDGSIGPREITRTILGASIDVWALASVGKVALSFAGGVVKNSGSVLLDKTTITSAKSTINGIKLQKLLASEEQMCQDGIVMAGKGSDKVFRSASRFSKDFGGVPEDWVKMKSSHFVAKDGASFEAHWVENIKTGKRVNFKTKFNG